MFKIGNVKIENRIIAAPMAGFTNLVYRRIAKEYGAALCVAEMVSDKALCYKNEQTFDMLKIDNHEHPVSMQLFGGELQSMVEAAKIIDKQCDCDIIDINMGCPVPKVLKAGAGSKWHLNPQGAYEVVKAIVEVVSKPVTVKMRLGWDKQHINVVEMSLLMEKAGASAITIHGRTRSQMYEGEADWTYIKQVKQAVGIPVIGNGDVRTPEDAKRMLDETGCDAVMIGRAALGNPWLFNRCARYVEEGVFVDAPSTKERTEMCYMHACELVKYFNFEENAMKEMRSHACHYLKGLPNANDYKVMINQMLTLKELRKILDDYLQNNP